MKHHIFRQTSRRILKHEQLQKPTSCKPTVSVKYLYPSFAAGTRSWSQRSSDPRKWGLCFWTINNCAKKSRHEHAVKWWGTELDEGKIITWTPDFNVNIRVSCKKSHKPTQWRAQKSSNQSLVFVVKFWLTTSDEPRLFYFNWSINWHFARRNLPKHPQLSTIWGVMPWACPISWVFRVNYGIYMDLSGYQLIDHWSSPLRNSQKGCEDNLLTSGLSG